VTYKEISQKYDIPERNLLARVYRLCLYGKGKPKQFTQEQVSQIIACQPYGVDYKNDRRKIKLIELYQATGNVKKATRELKMHERIAYEAVKEYKETEMITIESSMNKGLKLCREDVGWVLYDEDGEPFASTEQGFDFFLSPENIKRQLKNFKKKYSYHVKLCEDLNGQISVKHKTLKISAVRDES